MMLDRRTLLARTPLLLAGAAGGCVGPVREDPVPPAPPLPPLFDDVAERTFRFFWDTTNPRNGLAVDRWPTPSFSSIAATGFALTAYPIGVDRGWITRAQAAERTLATLRFFANAKQGDAKSGVTGHKGFFYHFLDMETGLRFRETELSSIDTTLLLGGVLFAGQWFAGESTEEREIRALARRIYEAVDWRWMATRAPLVAMGWHPERGFIPADWKGMNEAMLLYVLALGSPTHPLGPESWDAWCATYPNSWRGDGETRHLAFAPHFGQQYSQVWIDFRGIRDKAMREAGFDYFENSRRATWAQRAYAMRNPMGWKGYSQDIWGLTACDGAADFKRVWNGQEREFRSYSARGPIDFPDGYDDGTLAPTAAIASLPFAPEIVEPAAATLKRDYGDLIYGKYGFLDSFNPTITWTDLTVKGRVDPVKGWVDDDYLGIDQGPILTMIANHRDDFVWHTMRQVPAVRTGLTRAGFTGGWLS